MSIVRCNTLGCPFHVREGDRYRHHPLLNKTERGKEKADGVFCWRCRDGRTSHLIIRAPRKE